MSQDPKLVHYLYMLKENEKKIQDLWSKISSRSFFFVHPHMVVVGISYFASLEESEHALEADRKKLTPFIADAIGETTLAIDGTGHQDVPKALFEAGSLSLLESKDSRHHRFSLTPTKSELLMPFLKKDFPNVDGVIHKIEREIGYFQSQLSTITREKEDIDQSVSTILHQRILPASKDQAKDTELLEDDITKLSSIYAKLAGNMFIVNGNCDVLRRDLSSLEQSLEPLAPSKGGMAAFNIRFLNGFRETLNQMDRTEKVIGKSLENAKEAIEVVRTRVELLRSSESLTLQREWVAIQIAAGVIEFIAAFYYSLASWKTLVSPERLHRVPTILQFAIIFALSTAVVFGTHYLVQSLQKGKLGAGLILSLSAILLLIVLMAVLPYALP
jgi:hypothetical protein